MFLKGVPVTAAGIILLALAACGRTTPTVSTSFPTGTPSSSYPPSPTATAVPASPSSPSAAPSSPPSGRTAFTDTDNGKTVQVRAGQQFTVSLGSTYWRFAPLAATTVVQLSGTPVAAPSPGCIPGGGCGTIMGTYIATGTGQVTLTASRTSCGEAMLCTGSAGSFQLTVVVGP